MVNVYETKSYNLLKKCQLYSLNGKPLFRSTNGNTHNYDLGIYNTL